MRTRVVLAAVTIAGCRFHFDPATDDGGSTDATDAFVDVCAAALLCDDFDDGIPPATGMAQHDPTGGRDGAGALRADSSGGQNAFVRYTLSPPVTTGTLYARTHVKIAAGAPIQNYAVLLQLDNTVESMGKEKVSADLTTGDRFALVAPFAGTSAITTTVVRDQWLCLELVIAVDAGTAGTIDLFVAGERLFSTGAQLTMPPGGFSRVIVGLSVSSAEPITRAWFDDFIASTTIAGC